MFLSLPLYYTRRIGYPVNSLHNSLQFLFSKCTENFLLAFGQNLPVWCTGTVLDDGTKIEQECRGP
ncbi:hypothetical protein C3B58_05845 [Lactonifactor longoviformis]|nr:hypothetical protein C3B58_05845 [Lactonifactor longoviformis]